MKKGLRSGWSLWVSKLCLGLLTATLLLLDIFGVRLVGWLLYSSQWLEEGRDGAFLLTTLYGCSALAWAAVVSLWRLLHLLSWGSCFSQKVLSCLGVTAGCCFGVAALTLAGVYHYRPLLLFAIAACFMGCVVHLVQACFRNALSMQDELDFTV